MLDLPDLIVEVQLELELAKGTVALDLVHGRRIFQAFLVDFVELKVKIEYLMLSKDTGHIHIRKKHAVFHTFSY